MQFSRPIVLSIAGLDPSGGAGLMADIKTFELNKVYGLGILSAQTLQTEKTFISIRWENFDDIRESIIHIFSHYKVHVVKIGLVQNISVLQKIIAELITLDPGIRIVLDPVLRSSTNYRFWQVDIDKPMLKEVLKYVSLITPNYPEIMELSPSTDEKQSASLLSNYCPVLLKGGHNAEEPGVDYLYLNNRVVKIEPVCVSDFPKHGSGCVLSSAIASHLALGNELEMACRKGKEFTERFLLSNQSLLGYHVQ